MNERIRNVKQDEKATSKETELAQNILAGAEDKANELGLAGRVRALVIVTRPTLGSGKVGIATAGYEGNHETALHDLMRALRGIGHTLGVQIDVTGSST